MYSISVAVGDFNGDRFLDFLLGCAGYVQPYVGSGNGFFTPHPLIYTVAYPINIDVHDLNSDNRPDFVISNPLSSGLSIWFEEIQDLKFYTPAFGTNPNYIFTGSNSYPYSTAIGDFNNDGFPDIVVPLFETDEIQIYLGFGNGNFVLQNTISQSGGPYSVAIGFLNSDPFLDFAVTCLHGNNVAVYFGTGNANFVLDQIITASCPLEIAAGDLKNSQMQMPK